MTKMSRPVKLSAIQPRYHMVLQPVKLRIIVVLPAVLGPMTATNFSICIVLLKEANQRVRRSRTRV